MRVGDIRPGAKIAGRKVEKGRKAERGGFGDALRAVLDADGAPPVEAGAPLTAVDSLLALQEVGAREAAGDAAQERRRQQVRWGETVLETLDALKLALLDGVLPQATLEELVRTVREGRAALGPGDDPRLKAVLEEIELRAEVELAKASRA